MQDIITTRMIPILMRMTMKLTSCFSGYHCYFKSMKISISKHFIFLLILLMPLVSYAQEYTVGEGDVLDINVYENEDLSTTVRVSSDGTIRVPLVGEISVKDLTVSQVSSKIEKLFADGYLVNPQVDVFIAEHRSKKAIILGQIRKPGQYELRGRITFLEFVSKAGGLTAEAGSTAIIKRISKPGTKPEQIILDLEKLIKKGETSLNILIQDNDSIYISKTKTYYVAGEVNMNRNLLLLKLSPWQAGSLKLQPRIKFRLSEL